ncbi:Thiol:disulfide interchange protein DsbD precursor [Pannonibacter phragmitetus]|uniref:Thiol:disulfide interchange protein DsbD n=1 Tax=Pannonibacter phragmitetus TaxID=121719 RepID=A0A378ZTS7_9HYPH|nr:protein-disulfide reductase DsbD [Pannonibacter phragmitetus]SUB00646.1 Thiol:disulfide interchange protein DsbD precursor [Pannonibacter phragmitetus]
MRSGTLFIALAAMLTIQAPAQLQAQDAPLPMDQAFRLTVERSAGGDAVLHWQMAEGYYLYREYLEAKSQAGEALEVRSGPGKIKDDPGFGTMEVYYGTATASIASPPQKIEVTYQGCQDGGLCYPPTAKRIDLASLAVTDAGRPALPEAAAFEAEGEPGFTLSGDHAETAVDRLMQDGGLALLLAGFLGFGLLLAFTPCVFPMYPIVAAMLAREGGQLTARRGLVMSTSYVSGLAFAFALLGGLAAWFGQNLQMALQSVYVTAGIAALFVLLALPGFGLFSLQLPQGLVSRLTPSGKAGGTIAGAGALGFSSALFIGPCVTAPLAGALLYIARTGDALLGAMALFALGLGKGIPLIIMSAAGGRILPKAGAWMESVRQIFGFLFLATALWLVMPLLPDWGNLLASAALALTFGLFTLQAANGSSHNGMKLLGRSTGLASLFWAALLFTGLGLGASDPLEPLAPLATKTASTQAAQISKSSFTAVTSREDLTARIAAADGSSPALVYVTADWCVTCRTIERSILKDPQVASALTGITLTTLDVTAADAGKQALMQELKVIGPPTLIFLDRARREPDGTRLIGNFPAQDLADAAIKAKQASLFNLAK